MGGNGSQKLHAPEGTLTLLRSATGIRLSAKSRLYRSIRFGLQFSFLLAVADSCRHRLKIPQPCEVVVDSSGCPVHPDKRLAKRRQAMQECNLPRNSQSQTHQDDEAEGGTGYSSALGTKHRIDSLPCPGGHNE
jgi:hypothetical protein